MAEKKKADPTDVIVLIGILLIGIGTWLKSPPIALIVVGSLLLLISLTPYLVSLFRTGK